MIARMEQAHVEQIAALEKICFSDPWSAESVRYECTNPLSLWLVALDGDEVIGYIGSQSVLPEADVMNLAVKPQWRRQGIGRKLMDELTELLRAQGVTSLFLEVRESNAPAIALYENLGFAEVGRRKKYYVNPSEDALILRKEL